jgi:peptidyl-tRNA hydrolase, PTH2 family
MSGAVKMVIVVRTKFPDGKGGTFGMRAGKIGVQMCHAVEGLIDKADRLKGPRLCGHHTPLEREWRLTGNTKIAARVETEEELLSIFQQALDAQLPVYLVTDAGRTEFKEPTRTCLAIGPARADDVDKITGNLKLL